MRTQVLARAIALSCCALIIALTTACGGGGDSGSSGTSASSGGSASTAPPTNSGIDSAGGTVSEASGAKVVIPAGALTTNVAIAVTQSSAGAPPLPTGLSAFGPIYAFTPHGTAFAMPATITVPFDPTSVPAGTTLALYKTNATQSAWEVVSGATVNGNTMVGNVSGFSFAMVSQERPVKIEWSIDGFKQGEKPVRLEPKAPNDPARDPNDPKEDPCTGCTFDIAKFVGDPQALVPSGLHLALDDPTYWIFSFDEGRSFGSMNVAPHAKIVKSNSLIGVHDTMTETFTFVVDKDKPTLNFLITILRLEGFDDTGFVPNRQACPEMSKVPTPDEIKLCKYFRTGSEANIEVKASSFGAGQFLSVGGAVTVNGVAGEWTPNIMLRDSDTQLWHESDFDFSDDVDSDGGHHARRILKGSKPIPIPISNLKKGDLFQVEVRMETRAINNLQAESFIAAFFRDPLQGTGLDFESTGLTLIPARDDIPTTPQPLTCTTGVDPSAGTLQFSSPSFAAPERSDRGEVIVERKGGTTGPLSVRFTTRDASAKDGSDYEAVTKEVRFADGEAGPALITIPLLQDTVAEDDETVDLVLSDVGGCGALGTQSTATLTILDDDRPLPPPDTHTVGGTVSGLTGSGLVLKNVFSGSTVAASNGSFTMPDALLAGQGYDIRVDTSPSNPSQQCTVTNGLGTIADADVNNVQVNCTSLAPSGSLDPSFGSGGRVITTIPFTTNVFDPRMGMALQGDGRILLVGGLTLARFNSDGTLDSTFGNGGQVRVPFDASGFDGAEDVAVQPDGKIVVVGVVSNNIGVGKDDFALARFNADGTLDTTFGTGGKTITDFGGSTDQARRVKIQADGKILVTGFMTVVASPTVSTVEFALARYNSNGTLDTTFANGGKVRDSAGRSFSKGRGVAIQSDGRVIVAGFTADNLADAPTDVGLVRYWGDSHPGNAQTGQRDETFGDLGNGTVDSNLHLATSSQANDALVAADGTIMVAGSVDVGVAVGGRDRGFVLGTFDGNGRQKGGAVITKFTNQSDVAGSMLMQSDGKIVVVGQSANLGTNPDMALVRYDSSGLAPDASFGTDGKLTVDFFGGRDSAQAVVQQSDGKLIVGGFAQNGNGIFFALARLAP